MVIQHNIPALNSHRYLGVNNSAAAKNLEKLSSGFKINRAGDDAAGLAISEKMRTAINGLSKAEDNTSNAINLIQTAEGGMQELQSILQKMSELATQATNGTYANEVDREGLDLEFQQLKEEFNRIRDYTNYNGIKLLNGTPFGEDVEAASAKAITSLDQIVKGATGVIDSTTSTTGSTAQAAITDGYIDLVYDANGKLDLSSSKVRDNAGATVTGATLTTHATTGNLIVTFGNNGSVTIDGDWLNTDPATKGLSSAKISFSTDATVATTAGQDLNFTIKGVSGNNGANAATDLYAAITGTAPATGMKYTTNTLDKSYDLDFDMVFTKGILDVGKTNKALADAGIHGISVGLSAANKLEITVLDPNDATGTKKAVIEIEGNWTNAPLTADVQSVNFKMTVADSTGGALNAANIHTADVKFTIKAGAVAPGTSDGNPVGQADSGDILVFQVGARGTADQQVKLKIADMAAIQLGMNTDLSQLTNLGTVDEDGVADGLYTLETYGGKSFEIDITDEDTFKDLTVEDMHILDKNAANIAIEVVKTAIDDVSLKRANLGAVQNRLEHTLNNLGVTKENLTASESTIRDVDMAKEMMEFTKNSILIQSAQAMLAQANTLPQGVLQLLR